MDRWSAIVVMASLECVFSFSYLVSRYIHPFPDRDKSFSSFPLTKLQNISTAHKSRTHSPIHTFPHFYPVQSVLLPLPKALPSRLPRYHKASQPHQHLSLTSSTNHSPQWVLTTVNPQYPTPDTSKLQQDQTLVMNS